MPSQLYDPNKLLERGSTVLDKTEQEAAVRDYLKTGGVNLDPATQAWCASFVNATLAQEGFPTAKANARSFEKYGDPVLSPQKGDIGVFERDPIHDPDAPKWQGHAGFFTGEYDELGNPELLSGNVDDSVGIHLMDADRLVGWRRAPGIKEIPRYQTQLTPEQQTSVVDLAKGLGNVSQRMKPGTSPASPGEEWMNRYRNREAAYELSMFPETQTRPSNAEEILARLRNF